MESGVVNCNGEIEVVEKSTNDEIDMFVDKYKNTVYQLALAKTKNRQMAEDIFQEVFLKVIKKNRTFKNEEHEKAWIIRVTLNCCKDMWKSAWSRHVVPFEEYQEKGTTIDSSEDVYEAVMELPEKYRIPIHLFYYEEFSIDDISKAMKLNKNTVATRLKRARELLKENLKDGGCYHGF